VVDDEEGALCEGDPCREGEDDIGDPARRSAVEDLTTEWVAEPLRPHPTRLAAERKKGNEVPDPRLLDLDSVSDEVGPLAAVEEDGLNPGGCRLLQEEDPCQGVVEPVPDRPKEGDPLRVHGEGAVEGELEVGDVLLPRVDLDLDPLLLDLPPRLLGEGVEVPDDEIDREAEPPRDLVPPVGGDDVVRRACPGR